MVLMAQPVFTALDYLASVRIGAPTRIYFTPQGTRLNQPEVRKLLTTEWLVLLCGHYKDVDARVFVRDSWSEISIGDYVLSGGELPAAVLLDAMVRLLPGVLTDSQSADSDSFEDGLLDAPYYTKPDEISGFKVPDVLLGGHHQNIRQWRDEQRELRTRQRRPDLWSAYLARKNEIKKNHQ